jgi:hypothetical protein
MTMATDDQTTDTAGTAGTAGTADAARTADPVDPIHRLMEPIAGVSLELYARIVQSIAMVNHDLSMLEPMAALHGVSRESWAEARRGWNLRIGAEPAVNQVFLVLYHSMVP